MSQYQINKYYIRLDINNIYIVNTYSLNTFTKNLDYDDFLLCNNNSDLYELLNEALINKNIIFNQCEYNLICKIKINFTFKYKINITFEVPRIFIVKSQLPQSNKYYKMYMYLKNMNSLTNNITKYLFLGNIYESVLLNDIKHYDILLELKTINNYNRLINELFESDFLEEDMLLILKNYTKLLDMHENNRLEFKNIPRYIKYIDIYTYNDILNLNYCSNLKYLYIGPNLKIKGRFNNYYNLDSNLITHKDLYNLPISLEYLEIHNLQNLKNINFCKRLINLKGIALINCQNIDDLSYLPNLKYINSSGSSK